MPQPKKHASPAARQADYHQRREKARLEQLQAKGLIALPSIPTMPGYPRWRQALTQAGALLATVTAEMEQYADDRSEQWSETEKADQLREYLEQIGDVQDQLREITI